MSCIESLLREAGERFEPELQRRLGGMLGGIVRSYLPQSWVFETEDGAATLRVDAAGRVSVAGGAALDPDVTVSVSHDRLAAALRSRDRAEVPRGALDVRTHTTKGRVAFDYLRGRLGL